MRKQIHKVAHHERCQSLDCCDWACMTPAQIRAKVDAMADSDLKEAFKELAILVNAIAHRIPRGAESHADQGNSSQ